MRGEETFMQRASQMKRKRQRLAKAGERARRRRRCGKRDMQKLEVWRKNKCRRSGQGTNAECKETKAELRSRC